jgi:acetyl esterase/lipase
VAWSDYPADNDQSGKAFREAGIVEMYPSLRGGNANPGSKERFYGEVNDVLSARKYLASRADVDPNRIYLGGHSTGGTLALLVSEDSDLFRAVFSFGPVSDPRDYGADDLNYDVNDDQEAGLRAPGRWLNGIKKPTFILEGTAKRSNIDELELMRGSSTNPLVHFCPIPNKTHFSTLAPTTQLIAQKILQDNGPQCNITFTDQELVFP